MTFDLKHISQKCKKNNGMRQKMCIIILSDLSNNSESGDVSNHF